MDLLPHVRVRRTLAVALVLALPALGSAGIAHAATTTPGTTTPSTTTLPRPVVTKVAPLKVEVGQKLRLTGKYFIPGKNRNIVVFKRTGRPAVFVKVDSATATTLTFVVPEKLLPALVGDTGVSAPRRFRLRVLTKRLSRVYTPLALSPQVAGPGGFAPPVAKPADCDSDGTPDATDTDDDNDGLLDTQEAAAKTDACKVDTDGDGASDLFEVQSATDLNSRALPYPAKGGGPDPLVKDADKDYDGDGLTLGEEYRLWVLTTGGKLPLTYSDGDQDTNPTAASTPANGSPLDINGDGVLTDEEKDGDGDGLTNFDEIYGRMTPQWWAAVFTSEKPFYGAAGTQVMSKTSYLDPDSDGDRILDGADDQDHDGYTNLEELDRHLAVTTDGNLWINPYNPCLPDPTSKACTLHPPIGDAWAPFGAFSSLSAIPLLAADLGPAPSYLPSVPST